MALRSWARILVLAASVPVNDIPGGLLRIGLFDDEIVHQVELLEVRQVSCKELVQVCWTVSTVAYLVHLLARLALGRICFGWLPHRRDTYGGPSDLFEAGARKIDFQGTVSLVQVGGQVVEGDEILGPFERNEHAVIESQRSLARGQLPSETRRLAACAAHGDEIGVKGVVVADIGNANGVAGDQTCRERWLGERLPLDGERHFIEMQLPVVLIVVVIHKGKGREETSAPCRLGGLDFDEADARAF